MPSFSSHNAKEHAPPPLESEGKETEELHGGCCVSSCSDSSLPTDVVVLIHFLLLRSAVNNVCGIKAEMLTKNDRDLWKTCHPGKGLYWIIQAVELLRHNGVEVSDILQEFGKP